jgi:hypothetical protein
VKGEKKSVVKNKGPGVTKMMSKDLCLDCGICYNRFKDVGDNMPLVLPCGHTYCKICIENLYSHVCPTCKAEIHAPGECHATFPKNIHLMSLINSLGHESDEKAEKKNDNETKSLDAPKVKSVGHLVLFKRLEKATRNAGQPRPAGQDSRHEERLFLLNLSRISKERKAQDANFDAKRFVTYGLVSKFGEETARRILREVFGRIQDLRQRNAMPVSTAVKV